MEKWKKDFLPDNRYGGSAPQVWIDRIVHFKWKPANQMYQIQSYRCKQCGYLENYAK